MCALGVKISWEKSWVSYTGAFEMANRFMVDKGNVDLRPISAKSIRSVFVSSSLLYYLPGFRSTVLYGGLRPFAY